MATALCAIVPEQPEQADVATIEALLSLLPNERHAALGAFLLGRMGRAAEAAVGGLERAAADSRAEVRRAAQSALERIRGS